MRKFFLFLFLLSISLCVSAQDVIVKRDGSTIISKVLEVNIDNIKYKKLSNQNGPTYTISKSEIMCINYENGEKDTFDIEQTHSYSQSSTPGQTNEPRLVKRNVAENNAELIKKYDCLFEQISEPYDQNAKYVDVYMGITSSSVLSNEDLTISFDRVFDEENKYYRNEYHILIENKTDHIIYIDKGNTFRVINKEPYCYYDGSEQTTVGSSGGGGVSIGLGSVAGVLGIGGIAGQLASGISVGGGSSTSSSTTYTSQRVIAIPPHSQKALCENKKVFVKGSGWKTIDPDESFISPGLEIPLASQFGFYRGDIKVGQLLSYSENNTPYQRVYTITYSNSETFNSYSIMNFTMYLSHAIGVKYWSSKGENNIRYINAGNVFCSEASLEKR